jgi:hypothetical protein
MKQLRMAHLSVLMIGLALASTKTMAQSAPASDLSSTDTAAARLPSRPLEQGPILEYRRPTEKEKLRRFEFDAFGPFSFADAFLAGGFQQISKTPREWGTGWDAFGVRIASNFGIQLVTTTTRYGMAEILHEDTIYYPCQCSGFLPRLAHALVSTLTGRHGVDGHTTFSFSRLVSPYAGTMTSLAWYPDRYGVKDGFRMGNYNLLGQTGGNLGEEFIYGGQHTLFSRLRRSKSPDAVAAVQN